MAAASNVSFKPTPQATLVDITQQAGWFGQATQHKIEGWLIGKQPYTYALTSTDETSRYRISYVAQNLSIQHSIFNEDSSRYTYQNGDLHAHPDLEGLFRDIMHCSHKEQIRPLSRTTTVMM